MRGVHPVPIRYSRRVFPRDVPTRRLPVPSQKKQVPLGKVGATDARAVVPRKSDACFFQKTGPLGQKSKFRSSCSLDFPSKWSKNDVSTGFGAFFGPESPVRTVETLITDQGGLENCTKRILGDWKCSNVAFGRQKTLAWVDTWADKPETA